VVGLGCNNFGMRVDLEGTRGVVEAALGAGVTLFDTADIYGNKGGSEAFLGEALAGRRADVVVATKFGGDMGDGTEARGSREYIRKALEGSLQRLRTEYVDLYQYHTPDHVTPFEETFGALDELVREGKVRYVGHSNLDAAEVEEVDALARERGWARPVSAQNQYSLLRREAEVLLKGEQVGKPSIGRRPSPGVRQRAANPALGDDHAHRPTHRSPAISS
jgi:aryl-alcohol dehydrogenase-like predicted oxidoreductase